MKIMTMLLKASGYMSLVFFQVSSITILIRSTRQISYVKKLRMEVVGSKYALNMNA